MSATTSSRGILYFNTGEKCVDRMLVSIHSLRDHWDGRVALVNAGPPPSRLIHCCKSCNVSLLELSGSPSNPLAGKIWSLGHTPFEETLYLDADTLVVGPLHEFFDLLPGHDFVFTRFADWTTRNPKMVKRMESWRSTGLISGELIDRAYAYPAINVGTFVYRRNAFLARWLALTIQGAKRRLFIPDEVAAQLHLSELNCRLAPQKWGVSVQFGSPDPDNRVIHYHGRKHNRTFSLCGPWRAAYNQIRSRYGLPDLSLPRVSLVTAVDREYLATFKRNYPSWEFAEAMPFEIIYHGLDPSDLHFVGSRATLHEWDLSGVDQRERMLTSFVKLAPSIVRTPYWIKLDADCSARPGTHLFASNVWYRYDLVSHRWGYTKPGSWLRTLEEWGDSTIGRERLFTHQALLEADKSRRFRHPRLQSFACLHETEFSKYAASLCAERLPVPSHDTYLWYVATRAQKKVRTENIKNWGIQHPCRGPRTA